MSNEEIGFGRNISGTLSLFPLQKPDNANKRKINILQDSREKFKVLPNDDADDTEPFYTFGYFSEVNRNKNIIEDASTREGVNPDLTKAIVHLETTQGYYDRIYEVVDKNKSIRPMNIRSDYWKGLGYSRDDLKIPEKNIEAGVKLLRRIKNNMPDANDEDIATVYNNLGAQKVSDYGARIKRLMKEKPWE